MKKIWERADIPGKITALISKIKKMDFRRLFAAVMSVIKKTDFRRLLAAVMSVIKKIRFPAIPAAFRKWLITICAGVLIIAVAGILLVRSNNSSNQKYKRAEFKKIEYNRDLPSEELDAGVESDGAAEEKAADTEEKEEFHHGKRRGEISPEDRIDITESMYMGSEGKNVQKLQRNLKKKGYLDSEPDGKFGPATQEAVMEFQRDNKLIADGVVGMMTALAINGEEEIAADELASAINEQMGYDLNGAFLYASQYPYFSHSIDGLEKEKIPETCFLNFTSNLCGDCYCMAAAFCVLAQNLGYDAHMIMGYVPLKSGELGAHSWVEIDEEDGIHVFDPQFRNQEGYGGYDFFYGTKGTWMYMDYERIN